MYGSLGIHSWTWGHTTWAGLIAQVFSLCKWIFPKAKGFFVTITFLHAIKCLNHIINTFYSLYWTCKHRWWWWWTVNALPAPDILLLYAFIHTSYICADRDGTSIYDSNPYTYTYTRTTTEQNLMVMKFSEATPNWAGLWSPSDRSHMKVSSIHPLCRPGFLLLLTCVILPSGFTSHHHAVRTDRQTCGLTWLGNNEFL